MIKKIWEIVKREDDCEQSCGLYCNYSETQDELRKLFHANKDRLEGEKREWLNDSSFKSSLGLSDVFYIIKGRNLNV